MTIEELREDCERIAKRARALTKLNDEMKHRMRTTFWSFHEPLQESSGTISPQAVMEEYHAKLSQWLLQSEQDIIEHLEDKFWVSDERLCCICAAMSLKERVDQPCISKKAVELQPARFVIEWDGLQLLAEYNAAGITHANELICLIENAQTSLQRQYNMACYMTHPDEEAAERIRAAQQEAEQNIYIARLIDGIDRFLGRDTDWSLFQ